MSRFSNIESLLDMWHDHGNGSTRPHGLSSIVSSLDMATTWLDCACFFLIGFLFLSDSELAGLWSCVSYHFVVGQIFLDNLGPLEVEE